MAPQPMGLGVLVQEADVTHRTPAGWQKQYLTGRGIRLVNRARGLSVMRGDRWWYIYRSDGTKDPQPYSTWIDAVRDADKQPRKEQDGRLIKPAN